MLIYIVLALEIEIKSKSLKDLMLPMADHQGYCWKSEENEIFKIMSLKCLVILRFSVGHSMRLLESFKILFFWLIEKKWGKAIFLCPSSNVSIIIIKDLGGLCKKN